MTTATTATIPDARAPSGASPAGGNGGAFSSLARGADPDIRDILERALAEEEISERDARALYAVPDADLHLVGMAADELRRRRVGDAASYVVNRNINFTNVCIKQCGFCAFSRDFRGEKEGYMLPVQEIVRRAREAHELGATEVCIQAGLPPDMDGGLYEQICREIKREVPGIHIHGFSPEEILYGATRSGVPVEEFLARVKEAGVDTLPGTSAEILDQGLRDSISPGRITASDWERVIRGAHAAGLRTTSTMMFGHVETMRQRVAHMARIRDIQRETGGFTEFVPLNFVHTEAPMYIRGTHDNIRKGGSGRDVLLTHAIARIMLNNYIDNIQMSWVKEGPGMSQILLRWGANDFGGTLINESISTSAGSAYGQLLRPREIRRMIREAGRVPVERDTRYNILRRFAPSDDDDGDDCYGDSHGGNGKAAAGLRSGSGPGPGSAKSDGLDSADASSFGSYAELITISKFRYQNPRGKKQSE
ncbi:MAG: 5-amino-6-(D-ribitylamino)uracil--L-tyrosine 4-hydroxyphenyl transferase CofH [Thaumarchaeota archaeon]|nr:5-amino-6-(D-ribitylamino)uracil--L-tyrosine 4-hydroxyphenyl transferase CofH [Nitrososphaerota archaeon]MDE0526508.1 5-amino-6-(D-ribitylamino)uracil--L-tyrosine 4-hydroxyphenyl transferase CofH [Nitrososphaerota archaeon]